MKKIFLLHCFPVPYRNHLFEIMSEEAKKRNIFFEVQFYAASDKSRPAWTFASDQLLFKNKYWKPIFKIGSVLHLNLDLLMYIYREKPDVIISGGVWAYLNSILITLFIPKRIIAWDETNRFDFGSIKKKHIKIKKFLTSKIKFFASTGAESKSYYLDLLGSKEYNQKVFLNLPNIINESLFEKTQENIREANKLFSEFNIPQNKKIIYWPARFIADKGIEEFLDKVDQEKLNDWHIILVGDGILKDKIFKKIDEENLNEKFSIISIMPYEKARLFYFIADLFILPSLSDSNPLSVIEAIHSSLPIIISNRVGNYNEVLVEEENGISLDPYNQDSVQNAMTYMLSKTRNELRCMGEFSKKIALDNFSSKQIVSDFFTGIQKNRLI